MFKRVGLFLLTNLAIIFIVSIVIFLLENLLGISISGYSTNYASIFIFALIIGFTGSFISLFISKWAAKKAYGVQIVSSDDYINLDENQKIVFDVVKELSERENISMPEVGFYVSNDPNAFATGATKNSSLVAVSSGLLNTMNKDEIEGVIGHEMAHILNGDMVTMTLLQGVINTFVIFISRILANIFNNITDGKFGAIGYFVVTISLQIFIGILASLITMWFSRHREFRADLGSAKYLGKEKMISSLEALKRMQNMASGDDSKLATMKISTKSKTGFRVLFSTHPNIDDRINALKKSKI